MPTLEDLLNGLKFRRWIGGDEGSCFGVTDPARLRPVSDPTSEADLPPLLCPSCVAGIHKCEEKVDVINFFTKEDEHTDVIYEPDPKRVLCKCPTCHSKEE